MQVWSATVSRVLPFEEYFIGCSKSKDLTGLMVEFWRFYFSSFSVTLSNGSDLDKYCRDLPH